MAKYCWKHATWRRFGKCPKCVENYYKSHFKARPGAGANWWTPLTNRIATLVGNCRGLDQDVFGICGMASAVYLLLRDDPNKAETLFDATFADFIPRRARRRGGSKFNTASHGPLSITFRNLLRRYEHQIARSQTAAANRDPNLPAEWYDAPNTSGDNERIVDYSISRALGYLMKKVAPGRYAQEKTEFAIEFLPQGYNYQPVTRFGSLPLRTNNLAFILVDLLGAQNVMIAHKNDPAQAPALARAPAVGGVRRYDFTDVPGLAMLFDWYPNLGPGNSFAVAAVFADIIDRGPTGLPSNRDINQRLDYNHWVVIERFEPTGAGATIIDIWTWGQQNLYTITINDNVLLSYIQDVIFGRIP